MIAVAPRLETKRLILRDIQESDAQLIVKWRSNPDVYKYFCSPHPITIEEHNKWYSNRYIYDVKRFDFMALLKETLTPIGVFGIKMIETKNQSAEISYILSPQMQGNGYASEAVERLNRYIKEYWNCKISVAEIHKDNINSIRFAKNLGYKYVSDNKQFIIFEKAL